MATVILHHPSWPDVDVEVEESLAGDWTAAGWISADPPLAGYRSRATVLAIPNTDGRYRLAAYAAGVKVADLDGTPRLGRTFQGRPLQPITNRFPLLGTSVPLSNGTDTAANSEVGYIMTRGAHSIAIAYTNATDLGGAAPPNNITIRAGVRVNGAWSPVYFNGRRDAIIEPDGLVVSDPVGVVASAGDRVAIRTRVTVASGEKWPNTILTDNALGEGVESGTTTTDKTTTGTITASRSYGPSPFTVLANPAGPGDAPTLVGVGDSIMAQAHDTSNPDVSTTTTYGWGFARRWAHANVTPFLNLGVVGDTVRDWVAGNGRKYALRRSLTTDGAVVVVNFGRNDLDVGRTLDQIKADLLTAWGRLAASGAKVHQATITPKTASTDSWATDAGQTAEATEATRVALNDWIRTAPAPLAGYIEAADAVETARNSGLWRTDGTAKTYTTDGTHPAAAGHIAIAATIPARLV